MADPATLAVVAGGSKVAGTGLGTISQLQSLKAQQNYLAGENTFQQQQMKYRAKLVEGQQQAISAASGVSTSSGSPMIDKLETARQAALQEANLQAKTNFQQDLLKRQKKWTILGGLFQGGGQAAQAGYEYSQA